MHQKVFVVHFSVDLILLEIGICLVHRGPLGSIILKLMFMFLRANHPDKEKGKEIKRKKKVGWGGGRGVKIGVLL